VGNEEMALVDVISGAEYVPTYEDKDDNWMLVGDIPRGQFSLGCLPRYYHIWCCNDKHHIILSSSRQLIISLMDWCSVGSERDDM
jgi:hypothetical protein